jgi:hypothetical protein
MNGNLKNQIQSTKKPTIAPSGILQRCTATHECDECRKKRESTLQRAAINSSSIYDVPPIVYDVLRSPGHPLDEETLAFMEPRFGQNFSQVRSHARGIAAAPAHLTIGAPQDNFEQEAEMMAQQIISRSVRSRDGKYDLSNVRIHTDSTAGESARVVNALAYTVGHNIVFGTGQFAPRTYEGRRLIAHELTHVIQQSGSDEINTDRNSVKQGQFPFAHSATVGLVQRQTKSSKCSDELVTALNDQMHVHCNKPRSCSMQGDSCATATAKVSAGYGCVDERTKLQQKCFSPGDPRYEEHMLQIAQASAALRNCIAVMTAKCGLEAAAAAAIAAAVAAAAAAAKQGLKSAAGKAFVYAQVAAAVILLVSGKAEAKISLGGDSPLEALFKAMEQDGVPVSDDMKKLIESDPELKKMLEDAAKKGGKLSDAQKEIAKKYSEYISKHMDEFSREELQTLIATTDKVADKMPTTINVEDIKKSLKQKMNQKSGQFKDDSGSTLPKKGDATEKSKDISAKDATPQLSQPTRDRLAKSPTQVLNLFQGLLGNSPNAKKITDAQVQRFLNLMPPGLTGDQVKKLLEKRKALEGETVDQILDSLQAALANLNEQAKPQSDPGTTAKPGADATSTPTPDAPPNVPITVGPTVSSSKKITPEELIKELAADAKKSSFADIPPGNYRVSWKPEEKGKPQVGSLISGSLRGKLKNGKTYVGRVEAEVKAVNGNKLKIKFITATPMVSADETVVFQPDHFVPREDNVTLDPPKH